MNLNLARTFKENFGLKVFATFMIFIFVMCFSFTTFFIHHQSRSMTDTLIKKGKLLTGILAHNSRIGVFSENKGLLKDPVEGVFEQEEVREVCVFNQEGKLLKKQVVPGATAGNESVREDERSRSELFEKLRGSGSSLYLEGNDRLEFWSPVISSPGYSMEESLFFEEDSLRKKQRVIGFVKITLNKEILNKQLNNLLFRSISIGIIFLTIGSSAIYLLVQGMTRPLNRLTEAVKTLERGGDVKKVPVETKDEVGKLAKAFNIMSQSLKRREREKHELEEQLRHTQKIEAIGTLAGGIAHDFNNILAGIMGYTELALLDAPQGTLLQRNLDEILTVSRRAVDMVKQILTFSRKSRQEQEPIYISLIIKEALKMLRASLPSTIEIRQNIETSLTPVLANPTQIHQVLTNLCTNAAHAMRDNGGVLEISLADVAIEEDASAQYPDLNPGKYQRLTVSDTGHGMSPVLKERIFEPFFTTKKPGEGTGMGLAVVHGIAKSHDGSVAVHSEQEKGTTFQVFFPTVDSAAVTEHVYPDTIPVGKELILLVDDENALVDIGCQTLENLGYQVIAKTSSTEALEAFRAQPEEFDLVITDMTMPNMTGVDLAKEIMRIRSDMPIILCTGFSDSISEDEALALGIREFTMKPFSTLEIATIIRRALQG